MHLLIFLLAMGHIFLLLFKPGNIWLCGDITNFMILVADFCCVHALGFVSWNWFGPSELHKANVG